MLNIDTKLIIVEGRTDKEKKLKKLLMIKWKLFVQMEPLD